MTKPILFSGAMVRAILDGRKSMTRRVVKPKHQPFIDNLLKKFLGGEWGNRPLPYRPGMKLWVRETWIPYDTGDNWVAIAYKASYDDDMYGSAADQGATKTFPASEELVDKFKSDIEGYEVCGSKWHPSIFMPRKFSRITLEVVSVRVERLQEITEEDAVREGCTHTGLGVAADEIESAREQFQRLWDSIYSETFPWKSNPWVWVIEFRRLP